MLWYVKSFFLEDNGDGNRDDGNQLIRLGQKEYNIPWGAKAVLSCALGGKD